MVRRNLQRLGGGSHTRLAVALSFFLGATSPLIAAESATNYASLETSSTTQISKTWSISASFGSSQSLYREEGQEPATNRTDIGLSASNDFGFAQMGIYLSGSHDVNLEESELSEAQIFAAFPASKRKYLSVEPAVTFQVPVSARDLDRSLRGRIGAGLRLSLSQEEMGWTRFGLAYSPAVSYANFEYETARETGAPNSPFFFSHAVEASYDVTDSLSLSASVAHFLVQNTRMNTYEYWTHTQEISWKPAKRLALAFGHHLGDPFVPVRNASQQLNFDLIDDDSSILFGQLKVEF